MAIGQQWVTFGLANKNTSQLAVMIPRAFAASFGREPPKHTAVLALHVLQAILSPVRCAQQSLGSRGTGKGLRADT